MHWALGALGHCSAPVMLLTGISSCVISILDLELSGLYQALTDDSITRYDLVAFYFVLVKFVKS